MGKYKMKDHHESSNDLDNEVDLYQQWAILNSVDDPISVIDKDLNIIWVNETAKNTFGNDITGKKCYEVYTREKDPCQTHFCSALKAFKDGNSHEHESQIIDNEGNTIYFHNTANIASKDKYGNPTAVIIILRNITEHKKIIEQIQHRLLIEEALAKASKLLISSEQIDLNEVLQIIGEAVSVNRTTIFQFQETRDKVDMTHEWCAPGIKSYIDSLKDIDPARFPWITNQLTKGENVVISNIEDLPPEAEPEKEEFRLEDICSFVGIPLFSLKGILIGFMGFDDTEKYRDWTTEDIQILRVATEMIGTYLGRKQAEKIIEASETKFRTVFENAGGAIFIGDTETGNILDCNKLAKELIGRPREEIIGMHQLELYPKKEKYKAKFASHIKKGHLIDFEAEVRHKDGRRIPVCIVTRVMEIHSKKVIVGFFLDITERKKMEEELIKVQKLEALGVLAGGIAHDFNNLLTAVIGNLSLIELYAKSGENIFEVLDETKKASQQTRHLTQQLLTFSKGGEPIKEVTSISELINETVCFALSGSKLRCECSFPDNLWPVEIDKGQINQIINNLVINADQAMPQGGLIQVCAENVIVRSEDGLPLKEGKYIKISIKDHGIGIPEGYLSKIFDPYFTTKQKGSGLGLSITYSIIQKHEGHINVESKIGFGTTFSIYLPALEKEGFTVRKIEEKIPVLGKGKILFMDDQKSIRNMIRKMLTHIGYEVEFACDGAEAIEMYKMAKEKGQPFDIVVLDLTVPGGMGGKEAIQKLVKIDPKLKAIVSSGYSNDPVLSEYKNYGFKGVVTKPYEIQELSETLFMVMTGKQKTHLKT